MQYTKGGRRDPTKQYEIKGDPLTSCAAPSSCAAPKPIGPAPQPAQFNSAGEWMTSQPEAYSEAQAREMARQVGRMRSTNPFPAGTMQANAYAEELTKLKRPLKPDDRLWIAYNRGYNEGQSAFAVCPASFGPQQREAYERGLREARQARRTTLTGEENAKC